MPSGSTPPNGMYQATPTIDHPMTGFLLLGVGGDIASVAAPITITNQIHRVTGTAAITGITVPTLVSGYIADGMMVTLIPTGIFTWTTATNIGLAGTAVVGKALTFFYVASQSKWYPNYIA